MKGYLLGLDVGGTKTEAALMAITPSQKTFHSNEITPGHFPIPASFLKSDKNLEAKVIARARIPTEGEGTYEKLLNNFRALCVNTMKEGGVSFSELIGIGAGMPGTIHPEKQFMLNGNTKLFFGKTLGYDLSALLPNKPKFILENDATCFALSEVFCGAGNRFYEEEGKEIKNQIGIGIILGTGVGGGIIIKGHPLSGAHGGGGEIGHTALYPNGESCYCGATGCSESYLSGTAIEKKYKKLTGKVKKGNEIFDQLFTDPICKQTISEYKEDLVSFLVKMSNIFDPDYFVLGGGVSKRDELYDGEVESLLGQRTFISACRPKVYKHLLGDSAGVVGAALLNLVS